MEQMIMRKIIIVIILKEENINSNEKIKKRKQYKLKNFMNKNDFFYTKMN